MSEVKDKLITAENLKNAYDDNKRKIDELKGDLDTLNQGGLNLKEDFIGTQVNNWLDEHPEATTTVQNGSLDELKFTEEAKTKIVKDYVTPEMFGAVGDGVTDDTNAVQDCLNNSNKFKMLVGNYKITNSLIITGNGIKILGTNSRINYNGIDSAIIITKLCDSVIELGFITSQGNGIEIKSTSGNEWSQYTDIHFRNIDCVEKAIYFNTTAGWTNEIRIYDGKLNSGKYGIHADAHDRDAINNITIQNVGFEGIETGFYLANNIISWNIVNPRYHESYEILFETVGRVRNVRFIGSGLFYLEKSKFSSKTTMAINAPISIGGTLFDTRANIIDGSVAYSSHRDYINTISVANYVIESMRCPNFILTLGTESITLTSAYGNMYGVNEIVISNQSDKTITVYDHNGNIISNNISPWKTSKLTYYEEKGWLIEIMSFVSAIIG